MLVILFVLLSNSLIILYSLTVSSPTLSLYFVLSQIYFPGNPLLIPNITVATPQSSNIGQPPESTTVCMCASGDVYLVNANSDRGCLDDGGLCSDT